MVAQHFGENKACYTSVNGKYITISKEDYQVCPTGYQSVYSQMLGHNGTDFPLKSGQNLVASTNGYVVEICTEEARGLGIGILTDKKYYCDETGKEEYFKYRVWHLKGIGVKLGQYVKQGDIIGQGDNTGFSSGDHLHFEIKPVSFIGDVSNIKDVQLTNILQNNGYFGSVNPLPYFITDDIQEIKDNMNSQGFTEIWQKIVYVLKKYGSGR
jgi:murein DD-endopeptidase MepM/ murein hydrolase activator NlpD